MELDLQAFREVMEEQAATDEAMAQIYRDQEEQANTDAPTQQQTIIQNNPSQPDQESGIQGFDDAANGDVGDDDEAANRGKEAMGVDDTQAATETPKKKRNMQKWMDASFVNGERIYVKNRGRSERIAKQQMSKPFPFDAVGTGSTPDKAFDVSP